MNQILHELKSNRKSLLIWSLFMILITYMSMVKFSAFSESGVNIVKLLETVPKFVRILLGIEDIDLTSMKGFYSMMFLYLSLIATIHASMLGAITILKEERDHTADFLLTKPITRMQVIFNKVIAAFITIGILNILTLCSSIYFVSLYNKGEAITSVILTLMLSLFVLQSIFLSFGLCSAALIKQNEKSASVSGSILLTTFIISMIVDLNDQMDYLKYFSPFKYYDAKEIIYGSGFNLIFIILSLFLITGLLTLTFKIYERRDIFN